MANVLLVYPSSRVLGYRFPYSLIPTANYLIDKGHKVTVFDIQVEKEMDFSAKGYDIVGFSTLTGPQIKVALHFAKLAKKQKPGIPVVFGGVHVTPLPDQSVQHPLVDIVCRQEGEETMHELAEAAANGGGWADIKGIHYKDENGNIMSNPDRPFIDLEKTPFLSYDFLKTNQYVEFSRKPTMLYYETSRGCPHACEFCYDVAFHNRRWRAKSPERVVDEMAFLSKKYGPEQIWFTDDEFAVSKKRLAEIAELMLKRNVKVTWPIFGRADYVVRYEKDFLDLVKRAGCSQINFGVESGSPRVLEYIRKDITVEQVIRSVEILKKHNIRTGLSFIIGVPTETLEEIKMTFDLIDKLTQMDKNLWIGQISAFTPLPGTELYEKAKEYGFREPQSLEEWSEYYYNDPKNLSFLDPSLFPLIKTVVLLSKFDFAYKGYRGAGILEKKKLFKLAHYILCKIAQYRWQKKNFSWPIEWRMLDATLRMLKFGER